MRLSPLLLLCLLSWASCDIINPDEEIPSFVHIEDIDLTTAADGSEGADSEDFSDAWVYSGGSLIGAFELPATFPILAQGNTRLQVYAGVKENGISASRVQYGFLAPDELQVDLLPGETVSIEPEVGYLENILSFDIIAFETALIPDISEVGTPSLELELVENGDPSLDFLGAGYSRIQLNDSVDVFRLLTSLDLDLGVEDFVYLELDYNTSIPFIAGLRVESPVSNEIVMAGMNPTITANGGYEWRKIYINVGTYLDLLPTGNQYELVFVGNAVNGEGVTLLDNIKLVYPD